MILWILLGFIVTLAVPSAANAQGGTDTDRALKAETLFRFLSFVEWPPDVLAPFGQDSLVIGVLGDDPFGNVLSEVVAGRTVGPKAISVRQTSDLEELGFCQVVFISETESDRLTDVLSVLRSITVLTVGDIDGFVDAGGMVGLGVQGNAVRFAINIDAIENSELIVSSRILRMARIVETTPAGGER